MTRTVQDWHVAAAKRVVDPRPFIGGAPVDADGPRFQVVDPANGDTLAECPDSGPALVQRAFASARAAAPAWAAASAQVRKAVLLALADRVAAQQEVLALDDSLEVGKPISQALMEVQIAAAILRFYAESADKVQGAVAAQEAGAVGLELLEPYGVVAAIVPWNFPLVNAALKLGPALAAGNAVVLKPSEFAPTSALRLGPLAVEAGLPAGLLNILPGTAVTGAAIAGSVGLDLLSFTGSTATGRKVMAAVAAAGPRPVLLECGGKAPQLFLDEAVDLDSAIPYVAHDAFWNLGQLCVSRSRLIVLESLRDAVVEKLSAHVAQMQVGDPLDPATQFGVLASAAARERIGRLLAKGLGQGARQLAAGSSSIDSGFAPTLVEDAGHATCLSHEELFGPILTVHSAGDTADALRLANDTRYGLAATVWTGRMATGLEVARGLRAGRIKLIAAGAPKTDIGFFLGGQPRGDSGFGVEGGTAGLLSYLSRKSVEIYF